MKTRISASTLQPFLPGKRATTSIALSHTRSYICSFGKTGHTSKVLPAVHKNIPAKMVYLELQNSEMINLFGREQHFKTAKVQVTPNNSRNALIFTTDRIDSRHNKQVVHIEVATTAGQPFTVHITEAVVQVQDAVLNVNKYGPRERTESLSRNNVKILTGNQLTVRKPGFMTNCITQNGINTYPFDKNDVLSRLKGNSKRKKTRLSEVIPIPERRHDVTITTDYPTVAEKTLNTHANRCESESVRNFPKMLMITRDADYNYKK